MPGSFRHPPFRTPDGIELAERWSPEPVRGDGVDGASAVPQFRSGLPVCSMCTTRACVRGSFTLAMNAARSRSSN